MLRKKVTKVYKFIAMLEDKNVNKVEELPGLDDLLGEYTKLTKNVKEVSMEERLDILIDKLNKTNTTGIDTMSYALQLKKILFTKEELGNNVVITIVRNNYPFDGDRIAKACVVIALNENGFDKDIDNTFYFYYNPKDAMKELTQEQLQKSFDEKTLEYIEEDDPRIPGIKESDGIKL